MTTIQTRIFKCPFTQAIINFDELPNIPEGYKIYSHLEYSAGKQLNFLQFALFGTPLQQQGVAVEGCDIYHALKEKEPVPANLLDHFLEHPEDIPDELKGSENEKVCTFFWGTKYLNKEGNKCIRGMYWNDEQWKEIIYQFENEDYETDETWPSNFVALVAA